MIISTSLKNKEDKLIKILIRKEPTKKLTKRDVQIFDKFVIRKEMGINKELFKKYFSFQMPTAVLKAIYNIDGKKENNNLV